MSVLPVGQGQPEVPVQTVQPAQAEKSQMEKVKLEPSKPKPDEPSEIEKQQKPEYDFKKALQQLSETAHAFGRRFHFKMHEKTHQYIVQVIDSETSEVINEVPPEKVLNLVAQIRELVGVLVNKHA
ncbi:MAG: flagellar protein FlaG [Bacillota bacterium]